MNRFPTKPSPMRFLPTSLREIIWLALMVGCIVPLHAAPDSFAYILQADAFAKSPEAAAEKLAASGRDWIVLDAVYDSETPWPRVELDAIRKGKAGRKVIAYISIGEAEDYRPYWKKEWGTRDKLTRSAPKWLGHENPAWKGNYRVNYWDPEWQSLILSSVDAAMDAGFDGIYLDIVDGFESFEQDGDKFIDDRPNPATKQTYRRDMVEWVKLVAQRARAKNPKALVIPQNGSQLLAHPDFVAAISGIGIEDLFSEGNHTQPEDHTTPILDHLKKLSEATKPVLVIEYPTSSRMIKLSKERCHEQGFTWLITDRELKTLGESGH